MISKVHLQYNQIYMLFNQDNVNDGLNIISRPGQSQGLL